MAKKTRATKKSAGRSKAAQSDPVHTSMYLPRALWLGIRRVAEDTHRKAHDVMLEGIEMVLRHHGKSQD